MAKLSKSAAQTLGYAKPDHSLQCPKHGDQPWKRIKIQHQETVSHHNGWGCGECLKEIKETKREEKRLQKKIEENARRDRRKKEKEALRFAHEADAELLKAVQAHRGLEKDVQEARHELGKYESALRLRKKEFADAERALKQAEERFERVQNGLHRIQRDLEHAQGVVGSSKDDFSDSLARVRERMDSAQDLWRNLTKKNRKERDKTARRAARKLLGDL